MPHFLREESPYLRTSDQTPSLSNPIVSLVISSIPHCCAIWLFCNQQRHSCDMSLAETELICWTCAKLAELYTLGSLVLPSDRKLFQKDLGTHLKHSPSSIVWWISLDSHSIRHSSCKAIAENVHSTRPLNSYFDYIWPLHPLPLKGAMLTQASSCYMTGVVVIAL